jgi:hypothetical protein
MAKKPTKKSTRIYLTPDGIELVIDCITMARGCHEEHIRRLLMGDVYPSSFTRQRIVRFEEKINMMTKLREYFELKMPERKERHGN